MECKVNHRDKGKLDYGYYCPFCKKDISKFIVLKNVWDSYWDERANALDVSLKNITITPRLQATRLQGLKAAKILGKLGFGLQETALLLGTSWINGPATPHEIWLLGTWLMLGETGNEEIKESYDKLKEAGLLLRTELPFCSQFATELCATRNIDDFGTVYLKKYLRR